MPKVICPSCEVATRLAHMSEVAPDRPDRHDRVAYVCDSCGNWVGCHANSAKPLGVPANAGVRFMRVRLHEMLDPLWQNAGDRYFNADDRAAMRGMARRRVYGFLAAALGIPFKDCHVGMFDRQMCFEAMQALRAVTYDEISAWYDARIAYDRRIAA